MRYLCDTNILLEILHDRTHAQSCVDFLNLYCGETLMTDFSLFSLFLKAEHYGIESITHGMIIDCFEEGMRVIATKPSTALNILITKKLSGLDYDDHLQYSAAKENNLTLITLDSDFFNAQLDIPVQRPNGVG